MNPSVIPDMNNLDDTQLAQENRVIEAAMEILDRRFYSRGPTLDSPTATASYLKLQLAHEEHEVFAVVFLDSKHRVLAFEVLFKGTIDSATVHLRQLIKRSMVHNAAAVVLSHNHPSGCTRPSRTDIDLTTRIAEGMQLINVYVLDHMIIGKGKPYSMAEAGLINH